MQRAGPSGLFSVEVPEGWLGHESQGADRPGLRLHTGLQAHVELTALPPLDAAVHTPLELLQQVSRSAAGTVLDIRELDLPGGLPAARLVRSGRGGRVEHFALVVGPEATVVLVLACSQADAPELVPHLAPLLASLRLGEHATELAR